jgi:hypothetical protein
MLGESSINFNAVSPPKPSPSPFGYASFLLQHHETGDNGDNTTSATGSETSGSIGLVVIRVLGATVAGDSNGHPSNVLVGRRRVGVGLLRRLGGDGHAIADVAEVLAVGGKGSGI